jgi:predicted TIM-barrel fold metal-dependent hydrolase
MSLVVDVDQHLYERADMWREYIDPSKRDLAVTIEPDDLGYWWLGVPALKRRLVLANISHPQDGIMPSMGVHFQSRARGERSSVNYTTDLPVEYWDPSARVAKLDEFRVDRAVLTPHWGLGWGRIMRDRLDVMRANMEAWNRWAVEVRQQGGGRLEPVGHVSMKGGDPSWLESQLKYLGDNGIKAAIMTYGLQDGRRPSHPDHDRGWAAFVDNGIVPVFHVVDNDERASALPEGWSEHDDPVFSLLEVILSTVGVQATIADMALNGVFERFPTLKVACIELTASWIPGMMQGSSALLSTSNLTGTENTAGMVMNVNGCGLDIAYHLQYAATGGHTYELEKPPSEYVRDRVLASTMPIEPIKYYLDLGMEDMIMFGGDYPHCEGLPSPRDGFEAMVGDLPSEQAAKFYGGNAAKLLNIT